MDLINKTGFAGDQSPLVDPCGRVADAQCVNGGFHRHSPFDHS